MYREDIELLRKKQILCKDDVYKLIPQREPFLMIDEVVNIDLQNRHLVAIKKVCDEEIYFKVHFPNNPIMPGVLILEAMAQASSILGEMLLGQQGIFMLVGVEDAKFMHIVRPNCSLRIEASLSHTRSALIKTECKAFVGDRIVATATIKAYKTNLAVNDINHK